MALERLPPWAWDVITIAIIIAAAFAPYSIREFRADTPATLALALAPVLVIPLRRRWSIFVLVAMILFYFTAVSLGTFAPGLYLAVAVAMFTLTSQGSRRTAAIIVGVAVLAVIVLSVLTIVDVPSDARTVRFALAVAFAAAAGDAVRSRKAFLRVAIERADRAERSRDAEARRQVTEERLKIARDLHDVVAHQISVISLNAGVATSALDTSPERAKAALGTIRSAARSVLGEIGNLLEVLRSDDEKGTRSVTPQPGVDRLEELIESFEHAGLSATLRVEGDLDRITGAASLVAYRVVQEGLTNAHKHGAGGRADVLVTVTETAAEIEVTNPVLVLPVDERASEPWQSGQHGLIGLRERVASVRGTISNGPSPEGYRLAATLPLFKQPRSKEDQS
ncbi:MAG: histidine kinase [Leucobacter sp.]